MTERLRSPRWWTLANISEEKECSPRYEDYLITLEVRVFIVMPFQLRQMKRTEFADTWFFRCSMYCAHYV